MVTQCVVGVLFHVEAVSLTCDDTTDVCPGTELTCTCNVSNDGLIWTLPGSGVISIDDKGEFSSDANTYGIFVAVLTNNTVAAINGTGGFLESMLIYTANESLVDATINCSGNAGAGAMSTTITVTLAG